MQAAGHSAPGRVRSSAKATNAMRALRSCAAARSSPRRWRMSLVITASSCIGRIFSRAAARAAADPGDFGHAAAAAAPKRSPRHRHPHRRRQSRRKSASPAPITKTTAPPAAGGEGRRGRAGADASAAESRRTAKARAAGAEAEAARARRPSKRSRKSRSARRRQTVARRGQSRAGRDRATKATPISTSSLAMIQSHRTYPPNAVGSLGLPLEGTAVYLIGIRADGALTGFRARALVGRGGARSNRPQDDQEAAPFPPPPQGEFPGPGVMLEVTIHLFPGDEAKVTQSELNCAALSLSRRRWGWGSPKPPADLPTLAG